MENKYYTVEITETLQRRIEIKAVSAEEALLIAKDMYQREEIILDADDCVDSKIEIVKV
ncbi:hypothetical protein SDC9_70411 [bioreactor metagenome]|uniref:DpnD/PcfM-like C-terminal domain-containing protein n=1 Tax=bioreactor metagenome TaxID=1076179 RepID=A0A644YCS3_9ZZZZ